MRVKWEQVCSDKGERVRMSNGGKEKDAELSVTEEKERRRARGSVENEQED